MCARQPIDAWDTSRVAVPHQSVGCCATLSVRTPWCRVLVLVIARVRAVRLFGRLPRLKQARGGHAQHTESIRDGQRSRGHKKATRGCSTARRLRAARRGHFRRAQRCALHCCRHVCAGTAHTQRDPLRPWAPSPRGPRGCEGRRTWARSDLQERTKRRGRSKRQDASRVSAWSLNQPG